MAALSHPPQIHIVSSANPQSIIMNSNDDSAMSSKITHSKLNIQKIYIYGKCTYTYMRIFMHALIMHLILCIFLLSQNLILLFCSSIEH